MSYTASPRQLSKTASAVIVARVDLAVNRDCAWHSRERLIDAPPSRSTPKERGASKRLRVADRLAPPSMDHSQRTRDGISPTCTAVSRTTFLGHRASAAHAPRPTRPGAERASRTRLPIPQRATALRRGRPPPAARPRRLPHLSRTPDESGRRAHHDARRLFVFSRRGPTR